MRISTKGRYALEALLCLALQDEGAYASTREIAEKTGISDGYLEQLFIPLRKAGIVKGIRGPKGGYLTGREPNTIRVGDILRAAEGSLTPTACADTISCPETQKCLSRRLWLELFDEINACVDSITLADLVKFFNTMDVEYAI
jgi:Rrf2 family protein